MDYLFFKTINFTRYLKVSSFSMSTITSIYSGQLRTQATHLASGNNLLTDAPLDNNGRGEAFSPTDLVCAALGSCMMTIRGIVAQRHGS